MLVFFFFSSFFVRFIHVERCACFVVGGCALTRQDEGAHVAMGGAMLEVNEMTRGYSIRTC